MSWFRRTPKPPRIAADEFTSEMSLPGKGERPLYSTQPDAAPPRAHPGTHLGLLAAPVRGDRNVACMVTHGMGQQVPFQTVGQVAEALRSQALFQANRVRLTPDGDLLSRLEASYTAHDGIRTNVHLYEGYWAPLTEGKISFWQTLTFLYSGGIAGVSTCLRRLKGERFDRWMFGDVRDLPIKPGTLGYLVLMLLVVSFTVLVYAAFLHVLSGAKDAFHGHPSWPITHFSLLHPRWSEFLATLLAYGAWILQWLALAWHHVLALILLLIALVYTYGVNYLVVEYAGDVAIYVSSYKVSRFEETRTAIEKIVFAVGRQIYEASRDANGVPFYDEVVLVGHSLGSVITYDLLNQLIVWDQKECAGNHRVVDRTTRLITFGSPLDKTAFLFRTQISADHHYREALAGLQQPLILTYDVRPKTFQWINLYSPADIVSGQLKYYDEPQPDEPQPDEPQAQSPPPAPLNVVKNRFDPSAWIPVYAHTQYWTGKLLAETLSEALLAHHPKVMAAIADRQNAAH
jgi:hypothetical protein